MNSIVLPQRNEIWVWKHDPHRKLAYLGKSGSWFQFADPFLDPSIVWCEVLKDDLTMLKKDE